MPRFTVHPWRTHADLLAVRDQFYPNATQSQTQLLDPADPATQHQRQHAVTRILSSWKIRGNLPHAIESTALLTDAQLHHHSSDSNSLFSIRAVYTAALTRFVTGFCDIGRAREGKLEASSMLDIAKQIGMPVDFVALRHEAVHGELPSLPRLVGAAERALGWLWGVHWGRLEGAVGDGVDVVGVRDEARRVLKGLRSARREAFRMKRQASVEHEREVGEVVGACGKLCEGSKAGVEAVVEVLVDERFIIPSSRDLGDSLEGAFIMWDPLIRKVALSHQTFVAVLMKRLHAKLTESIVQQPSDAGCEAASLWLIHILDSLGELSDAEDLRANVLKACCLYQGHWSRVVGQHILDNDQELLEVWQEMFNASMLSGDGDETMTGAEIDAGGGGLPMGDLTERAEKTAHNSLQDMDVKGSLAAWRRAPLSPRVPIGVVA